jgi:hypothetical protein
MAPLSPGFARLDEDEARTVSPGQGIGLDWRELSWIDGVETPFSGDLTLQAAGAGMNEAFCLDTEDHRITFARRTTAFYREMLVHVDGDPIGSYVDLDVGPYFKMKLQHASRDHMKTLLERIRFTVLNDAFPTGRPGPRVITAELQEQGSGLRATAQTMVNVIVPSHADAGAGRCKSVSSSMMSATLANSNLMEGRATLKI